MKRTISTLLIIAILASICCFFTACSSEKKLVGQWVPEERVGYNYPDEHFELRADGSGTADGYEFTWWLEDGRISMLMNGKTYTYMYSLNGNTLYLDSYPYTRY